MAVANYFINFLFYLIIFMLILLFVQGDEALSTSNNSSNNNNSGPNEKTQLFYAFDEKLNEKNNFAETENPQNISSNHFFADTKVKEENEVTTTITSVETTTSPVLATEPSESVKQLIPQTRMIGKTQHIIK